MRQQGFRGCTGSRLLSGLLLVAEVVWVWGLGQQWGTLNRLMTGSSKLWAALGFLMEHACHNMAGFFLMS